MSSKYKVIKLLRECSVGKNYLCSKNPGDVPCIIKQIVVENMTKSEKDYIIKEAYILTKLDHQNIIKYFEVFESKSPKLAFNIVTEYADGGDLSEKIKKQNNEPFKESEIIDYFTQICLALKHIHEKKIIHRNLKSKNVLFMKNGVVKLGGFGSFSRAKAFIPKHIAKSMIDDYNYSSPEILSGKPYNYKSDIWALGVLLYEMMTFKMPFQANCMPMHAIKIMRGSYNPIPMYSKELKDIVSKCLLVDPDRRPSINEILEMPIIQNRIKNLLTELECKKECTKVDNKESEGKNKEKNKSAFKDFLAKAKKEKRWGDIDQTHGFLEEKNQNNNKIKEEQNDKFNLDDICDNEVDNEDKNKKNPKEENDKEIELMRIELEKVLGLNLFKEAYNYVENDTDKKQIKYDKIKVEEKIKNDFGNKGFNEKEINLAIEKLPEIFEIVKKKITKQ
jgi:serine/threonine protein kinase